MLHKAEHIVIFAVYRKFWLGGRVGRYFKVAYPDYKDAETWVNDTIASYGTALNRSDFIIEEMPATMKAWKS